MTAEILYRGAFAKSLATRLPKVKDHHGVTVGQATKGAEDDHGLYVEGRIYPTAAGTDLATLMRAVDTDHGPQAPVQEGSVGWAPVPGGTKRLPSGVRELAEVDVFEVSPVTFGMNSDTRIGLVKGHVPEPFDGSLDDLADLTGRAIRFAVLEAEGLVARRKAQGRELALKTSDALAALRAELELGAERVRGLTGEGVADGGTDTDENTDEGTGRDTDLDTDGHRRTLTGTDEHADVGAVDDAVREDETGDEEEVELILDLPGAEALEDDTPDHGVEAPQGSDADSLPASEQAEAVLAREIELIELQLARYARAA